MELLLKSKNLSTELTEDLEFLFSKLLSSFAKDYINLENIRNNVVNLKIKLNPVSNKAINYNHKVSAIELNPTLFDNEDLKHSLMREAIHISASSSKSLNKGIEQDNMFNLLNDAIASSLADALIGNEKAEIEDSKVILNLMNMVYTEEAVLSSYFNNDPESLLNVMGKTHSHTMTVELLSKIESNNLPEAQKDLFDIYLDKSPSHEELEKFKSFMILDANLISSDNYKEEFTVLNEYVNSKQAIKHSKQL
jgi:hypothetical protein